MAARPKLTPAQKPRLGKSQIPSRQSPTPSGSRNPVESTNTLVGKTAANAAAATATWTFQ